MSLQSIVTAYEGQTFDAAPSGFLLSLANEGSGSIVDFVGVQPLTFVANSGTVVGDANGGVTITSASSATGLQGLAFCNTGKKFAFEAKISKADLTDSEVFVGVGSESIVAAKPIASSTAVSNNTIGFLIAAGSATPVVRDASAQVSKSAISLSAGEFISLGIILDPADGRGVRFMVDGQEVATQASGLPASSVALNAIVVVKGSSEAIGCEYIASAVKR